MSGAKATIRHLVNEAYIERLADELGGLNRIWKWNISPRIKCFWWLVLHRSILTWDNLVKRGFCGQGICTLCFDNTGDIDHLFVFCGFTKYIWYRLAHVYMFADDWKDTPLAENFVAWSHNHTDRIHFPIVVCWILWKVRNSIVFAQTRLSASAILNQITQLYSYYPAKDTKYKRLTQTTSTSVTTYWIIGTFDGAEQGGRCGGGGTVTLQDGRVYHFKVGLGTGTNNRSELLSLCILLWTAKRLNCEEIQIFGDSQTIIDWIK